MTKPVFDFESIRPFRDHEVNEALTRIMNSSAFNKALEFFPVKENPELVKSSFSKVKSSYEFQSLFFNYALQPLIKRSIDKIHVKNLDRIKKNQKYLFLSNHRDIVMDSGLLNIELFLNDIQTSEIAIGSNLLDNTFIKDLVRLNKSFMVHRDVSPKEMYQHSQRLSAYIRTRVQEDESSIWLAQAEGRSKIGDDRTQPGLLKMLNISGDKALYENFQELNIRPFVLSYEFDPCAGAKANELYIKEQKGSYQKAEDEDLNSMMTGMSGHKGQVEITFGESIDEFLEGNKEERNLNRFINKLKNYIDQQIHLHYKLWPSNYIAADFARKLKGEKEIYQDNYNKEDVDKFEIYLEEQLVSEKIEHSKEQLLPYVLKMFAMPLYNKIVAEEEKQ